MKSIGLRRAAAIGIGLGLLAITGVSEAHKPSDSYLTLEQPGTGTALAGQWDIALRDLDYALGLDLNEDGDITWGELRARQAAVADYALGRLSVEGIARGDRSACPLRLRQMLVDEHVDGGYAVLQFTAACPVRPAEIVLHYALLFDVDPNHRGLFELRSDAGSRAAVLSTEQPTLSLNLGAPDRWSQFREFVGEGVWHIWTGYDHMLFLVTLLLPAVVAYRERRWQARTSLRESLWDVLKVVTAFTVAHSLTLSLAVAGLVHLPTRLVESGIALTVLFGALNNWVPVVRERRWLVAFGFGLIHGLGFASVLADLGLVGWNLVLALISFNTGVEVGQMAIVLLLVPAIFLMRGTTFYRLAFMPAGAAATGLVAAYWFCVRAFGPGLL
jgi:hypothetical protein